MKLSTLSLALVALAPLALSLTACDDERPRGAYSDGRPGVYRSSTVIVDGRRDHDHRDYDRRDYDRRDNDRRDYDRRDNDRRDYDRRDTSVRRTTYRENTYGDSDRNRVVRGTGYRENTARMEGRGEKRDDREDRHDDRSATGTRRVTTIRY